ncbi:MAG: hypothetical protein ACRCYY_18640 [Trueperaceae bacterium]
MFTETEYATLRQLWKQGDTEIETYKAKNKNWQSLNDVVQAAYKKFFQTYKSFAQIESVAGKIGLWHHRIAMYGSPCQHCGKVLKTPKASKCFECGQPRGNDESRYELKAY